MLLSKKISKLRSRPELRSQTKKLHEEQTSPHDESPQQQNSHDKRKVPRYRYRQIPLPSKYVCDQPVYSIHGDWPILVRNNEIVTEISLFNEYKTFQNITVEEHFDQKVVIIKPNARKDKELNSMNQVMDLFSDQTSWPKTFKNYYQTYDKVMKRQSRKKTKSDTRKRFYTKVDAQTEEKTKYLFANGPVLQLKFRLRNHHSQLYEIVVGEDFVKELGHTTDSFVTLVLQEGLPQIMPFDNPCSTFMMKSLIENYFTVEEKGCEINGLNSTLLMKNGYVKDIQYQANFLMNYETNTFGMDVLYSITAKSEPYLQHSLHQANQHVNENFIQSMIKLEEETDQFLSEYYESHVEKRYCNLNKICRIKELEPELKDDEICVKEKSEDICRAIFSIMSLSMNWFSKICILVFLDLLAQTNLSVLCLGYVFFSWCLSMLLYIYFFKSVFHIESREISLKEKKKSDVFFDLKTFSHTVTKNDIKCRGK